MKTWEKIITEAKSKREQQLAAATAQLADTDPSMPKSLQSKEKRTKDKKDYQSAHTKLLRDIHDFKKQKYEAQKQAQIEKLKKQGVEKHAAAAKASLSGIKTQQISSQDKEGTAYSKAMGNVGSAAAGVAGAAIHGAKWALAKRKANAAANAAKETQPEKKDQGAPGRPPTAPASKPSSGPSGPKKPGTGAIKSNTSTPTPTAPAKRVAHKAPTIYGFPVGRLATATAVAGKTVSGKFHTFGRGGENALSRRIDKANTVKRPYKGNTSNIGERYSNWRDELLTEQGLIIEIDDFGLKDNKKEKGKKKIIDVMKGKNKIDINPNENSVKEELNQTDTSQIQQQQVQTRNQTMLQQKQQSLQQKLQQISKQRLSLVKQGKLALPGTHAEAYRDEEGGMARNELSTAERAIKSLRGKIKSNKQQLPAWVQSKITKAADHIDTVADYMLGETEPVKEAYDDENETFRQHSRERFTAGPADDDKAQRTARILQRMKEMNKDAKPKKKKKLKEEGPVLSVGRGEKLSVERGGGLTQKGRDKYNRATGSNLQAPVTGDVKPGSKAAQRRKNFCSRSRSWKGERGLAARRRWKC
jgi:hypothetical protein